MIDLNYKRPEQKQGNEIGQLIAVIAPLAVLILALIERML